jgi:hypothetical protein
MPRALAKHLFAAFIPPALVLFASTCYAGRASEQFVPAEPSSETLTPETDSTVLASLPLEQLMDVSVITTASKFQQPISDAPSAAVVLTAQDIK